MFSGLGLGNIMGAPSSSGQGLANAYNPYAQTGHWNQQAGAAQQHLMSIHARQGRELPQWIFDGQPMSFEDFVEAVFPEDCPQKTFFLLKFSK